MKADIRIAVVEDSRTTREALKTFIDLAPDMHCIAVCDTGEEALRRLPKLRPEVVLMDLQLPGISGIECVAELKRRLPEVLIIMVTVYEDPVRIFGALRAGACGYLLKRSTPEEIIAAIREVRAGGGAMSGGVTMKVIQYISSVMPHCNISSNSPTLTRVTSGLFLHVHTSKSISPCSRRKKKIQTKSKIKEVGSNVILNMDIDEFTTFKVNTLIILPK